MNNRIFIEDQVLVKKKLQQLLLMQPTTKEHEEIYIDTSSGDKWEKYEFELNEQTDDAIGLRRYPYPSIEEIVSIASKSIYLDEVSGAAALLWELDRKGIKVRTHLLKELELMLNEISIERFEIIYWRTEIYDTTNNISLLDKSDQEIENDAAYYRLTALKAKELREKIIKEPPSSS